VAVGGTFGDFKFRSGPRSGESELSAGIPRPPPEDFNLATRQEMIAAIRERFRTRSTLVSRTRKESASGSMHRKAEHPGFHTRVRRTQPVGYVRI